MDLISIGEIGVISQFEPQRIEHEMLDLVFSTNEIIDSLGKEWCQSYGSGWPGEKP